MKEIFSNMSKFMKKTIIVLTILVTVCILITIVVFSIKLYNEYSKPTAKQILTCSNNIENIYYKKSTYDEKKFTFDHNHTLEKVETVITDYYQQEADYIEAKSNDQNVIADYIYNYFDENKKILKNKIEIVNKYYNYDSYEEIEQEMVKYQYTCSGSIITTAEEKENTGLNEKRLLNSSDYIQYELIRISDVELLLTNGISTTGENISASVAKAHLYNYNDKTKNVNITISLYDKNSKELITKSVTKEMIAYSNTIVTLLINNDTQIKEKALYYSINIENI